MTSSRLRVSAYHFWMSRTVLKSISPLNRHRRNHSISGVGAKWDKAGGDRPLLDCRVAQCACVFVFPAVQYSAFRRPGIWGCCRYITCFSVTDKEKSAFYIPCRSSKNGDNHTLVKQKLSGLLMWGGCASELIDTRFRSAVVVLQKRMCFTKKKRRLQWMNF